MKLCSIASSSSGNSIYIGTDTTHLLVDCGISCKRLRAGLGKIGVEPGDISGIVITHEHSDHIKGIGVVSRRYGIPLYATERTWENIMLSGVTGYIDETLYNKITPDRDFLINDLVIHPFNSSHDAVQPVCFTFRKGEKKISVATDLGCYNSYIKEKLAGSNALFIEANHDVEMLKNGSYPAYLKKRILSDRGHLSNEMSGRLVAELVHEDLKYIMLGHLSRENNRPEIAHKTVMNVMLASSACTGGVELLVSEKDDVSQLITV